MNKFLPVVVLLPLLVSCAGKSGENGRRAIPYVMNVLSGTVPGRGMLENASEAGSAGMIYVYGDSVVCTCISDSLVAMDRHDNASGSFCADLLPDLAGETIASIVDSAGRTASDYLSDGDTVGLRRLAVNILLNAVDTVCYLSRFDKSGMGRKRPAKQVILADPAFALYGKYDVDTLLSASNCDVKVIIPVVCAFDAIKSLRGSVSAVAVMSGADSSSYRFYSEFCRESLGSLVEVYCGEDGSLRGFMDSYIADGNTSSLDFIVVDCCSVNVDSLYEEYRNMTDVRREDYVLYGHLFSKDFRIVPALRYVMEACHSDMRERNVFTHDIVFPSTESYYYINAVDDNSAIKVIECSR